MGFVVVGADAGDVACCARVEGEREGTAGGRATGLDVGAAATTGGVGEPTRAESVALEVLAVAIGGALGSGEAAGLS